MKERYHVSGMTCSACSSHVEKSVNNVDGVEKASVNLLTETMEVIFDENRIGSETIINAVEHAGYGAALLHPKEKSAAGERQGKGASLQTGISDRGGLKKQAAAENTAMKWRLGISIAFLLPLMYVAMFHMYESWFGLPVPDFVMRVFHGNENAMNFALTQFLLLLPILYVNRKFFTVGFRTLGHLAPNMDSLIALGASAAVGYGIFAMYRISYGLGHGNPALVGQYSHDLYFESAGMILTLITVGKYLEGRSKGKTSEAITKLMDLSPKTAVILDENGEEKEIPTEELQAGDLFVVKPGSLVPVDGIVVEGSSSVDEAAITGESVPVEKQAGDKVVSATVNKAGFLKCRAERVGEDTTLAQIVRLVEEASASKAPIALLADKLAGVFVPIVLGIALLTLIGWLLAGAGAEFAISTAIAVLVISCPCALGLATPVAIMVGTGVGAGQGILIKSGEALQQAGRVDTVVLDKTGTITEGSLKVTQVRSFTEGFTEKKILLLAAALERQSEHPLAEAVVQAAKGLDQRGETSQDRELRISDFRAVFGRGIEGVAEADWVPRGKYFVGNAAYLAEQRISLKGAVSGAKEAEAVINELADEGQTPLLVADEKNLLGIIGVADTIKESSQEAIAAWHAAKVRVIMLTGDNQRTAEAVRRKLQLEEAVAEVLPQDKEKKIAELKKEGHVVAMIGDGINDAPALTAADVGLAIGAGTDVALESADIVLMKNDLRDAVTAMRLSKAVIRNIRQNLFWAFFYNSLGIPLAAGLLFPAFKLRLSPMFGAAAMSFSSIFVVGNALRLRRFKSTFGEKRCAEDMENVQSESEICEEENSRERRKNSMIKIMTIEGMMCGHCTGRVQKALEAIAGEGKVTVSLEEKTATIQTDAELSDEVLTAAVTDAGYEVLGVKALS